jgi:hypothetical protein
MPRDVNFICKWRSDGGIFFPVGMWMEEKIPLKEVWGLGQYFTPAPWKLCPQKLY